MNMKEKIYNSENIRIFKRAAVKVIKKTTGCQKDDIIVTYNAKQKKLAFGVNTADNDTTMHEEIDKTFKKWFKNDLSAKKTIKKDSTLMEIIKELSPQPVINQQMVDRVKSFVEGDEDMDQSADKAAEYDTADTKSFAEDEDAIPEEEGEEEYDR